MSTSLQFSPSISPLVAPLAQFGRDSLPLAGGKGANLGELLQAGFDVPPGFVITTSAFDLLLKNDGLLKDMRCPHGFPGYRRSRLGRAGQPTHPHEVADRIPPHTNR